MESSSALVSTHATHATRTSLLPPPFDFEQPAAQRAVDVDVPIPYALTPQVTVEALPQMILRQLCTSKRHRRLVMDIWQNREEAYRIDSDGDIPTYQDGRIVALDRSSPLYPVCAMLYDVATHATLYVIVFFADSPKPSVVRLPLQTAEVDS